MNLMPGKLTLESCDTINRKRLFASKYKEMYSTKKKKNRRNICRGKAKEGQTYKAGAL